ncbi:MarR family transcriptional regulator [Glycomyces sp. A-F 0318]|uniref:MarR family winged helix-turn-helix transcriptional regulator n=1 Tax=Glycomyces amatae TaxID=2881355 RepID=UPI001E4E824A|nr:helix-turn-helix domain-containing protein [Glycomyces amatae]MCD0443166.1 MarR family transcriptional regulator [Glycomyces amatae]
MELALLGRTLMKLGEAAIPTEGLGAYGTSEQSVVIVAADIRAHPGTPVKDVAARTGFPQSRVSACVARLREAGAVETDTDPADRRRTLIRPAAAVSARVAEVRAADADHVLAAALEDPDRLDEVKQALRLLAAHLGPGALARIGG